MNIWSFIEEKLSEENSLYLMMVVDSKGSSPGKPGFSMAVSSDDELYGSIGGGSMEYKLVEYCKKLLRNNEHNIFLKKQIHNGSNEDSSGLMCSGEQTIAFLHLSASDMKNIRRITSCLDNNKSGIFSLTENQYSFTLSEDVQESQFFFSGKNNDWLYKEIIGFKNNISIIGAGHVGFALSKLFSQLGFKVFLYDNRNNFKMFNENPFADKKFVIDYKKADQYVVHGSNSYVVIMTNNHKHDIDVLRALIDKKVNYLGLMGSKNKVSRLKKKLKNEGATDDELSRLYAPIGISIHSQTPDEIAISIAAEIINVKNA
jgi:xanthine dehydrogenase accessory factor